MKRHLIITFVCLASLGCKTKQTIDEGIITNDTLGYHQIRVDTTGKILPWYSSDPGKSYDTVLSLVWDFWKNMEVDSNGQKYYMNHQVWKAEHDPRGLGGDQFSMALSSWRLLYFYTGKREIIENMKYLADYYLANSLSDSNDSWPFLPYPYNTDIHSGKYDGDMKIGKGYLQPDKAGSFGYELVNLYKITEDQKYLKAAIKIAQTLASKMKPGDSLNSPLPFKVQAKTGAVGILMESSGNISASYTSNWAPTLRLFEELFKHDADHSDIYKPAFNTLIQWMMKYPMKNNRWGPFFEDIPGWSDTEINAITWVEYIIDHQEDVIFQNWPSDVRKIFEWVDTELGNKTWEKYGVLAINEQTKYRVPGNSHTSRMAAAELMMAEYTREKPLIEKAILQLNWATYMVNNDGANRYYHDDIWLTDGYGDYVRHYIHAMGSYPELAPSDRNHMLKTSSVIRRITYFNDAINYYAFDNRHRETFRLLKKPVKVVAGGAPQPEVDCPCKIGWNWHELKNGGILIISTDSGNETSIIF